MEKTIKLNSQEEELIRYFLEKLLDQKENYGETTKKVAQQIISKLEE